MELIRGIWMNYNVDMFGFWGLNIVVCVDLEIFLCMCIGENMKESLGYSFGYIKLLLIMNKVIYKML